MNNKLLNKSEISSRTKQNIIKAVEIIIDESISNNKAIVNILKSVNEDSCEYVEMQKCVLSGNINCCEIYEKFDNFNKSVVSLILSVVIKNNIRFLVIKKSDEEINISATAILNIEKEPDKYRVISIKQTQHYEDYAKIFNVGTDKTNMFISIVNAMKEWFFGLSLYQNSMNTEYIGKGKFSPVEKEITDFKDSLKGAYASPYWYVSKKLTDIFKENISEKLYNSKKFINSSLQNIRNVLHDDIDYLFPKGLYNWYCDLPSDAKNRIYQNSEKRFFKICQKSLNGDNLDEIILCIVGIKLDYWNNDMPKQFYKKLQSLKADIEKEEEREFTEGFKISLFREGKCTEKRLYFSPNQQSKTISLIKKDILSLLNDYGESVSYYEKIEAMLEVAFINGGKII